MTLKPLQNWFEKMSSRERFMLLAVAWAVVIMWGSLLIGQVKTVKANITQRQVALKKQDTSLAQKPVVEQKIKHYQDIFKTSVSMTDLVNRVTSYYQAAKMPPPTINSNRNDTKKDSIFNINSVTIHFARTPLRTLTHFLSLVNNDEPNLIIDELVSSPERSNLTLMSGDVRIFALELKPGALDSTSAPAAVK